MNKRIVGLVLLGLFIQAPVYAANEDWQFELTPYLWFAGLKGEVATVPPLPAAPVDISPGDALQDTQTSLMLLLTAMKNQQGVFFDFLYSDVESDEELIPAPISLNMTSRSKTTMTTLAYQYEAYRNKHAVLDILAGARYWSVNSKLTFSGGLGILAGTTVTHDESWVDPIIGFTGHTPLGNSSFYMSGGAGAGGFGVGSDNFYELNLNFGYQWNQAIGTSIGYRMFDIDYNEGDFLYDVRQEGWLLGLTWTV